MIKVNNIGGVQHYTISHNLGLEDVVKGATIRMVGDVYSAVIELVSGGFFLRMTSGNHPDATMRHHLNILLETMGTPVIVGGLSPQIKPKKGKKAKMENSNQD